MDQECEYEFKLNALGIDYDTQTDLFCIMNDTLELFDVEDDDEIIDIRAISLQQDSCFRTIRFTICII